MLEGSTPGHGL